MTTERSLEIDSRLEFPVLLNWRRLYGHVVEVGVDRGTFSHHLLTQWHGASFFGVDSYESCLEFPGDRDSDYQMAVKRYEQFGNRARLLRCTSVEAAEVLSRISYVREFDFVYIDAGHEYAEVMADLKAWWPLVTQRGIMAGHDYDDTHPGVITAIDEFFGNMPVYITHEASCPSWYVYKAGTPGADWRRHPCVE